MHGIPKAEALRLGDGLIERVGLTDAADRKVGGYSGGMRRRLDLALALVHQPRLLFLDEPTTGLDVQSRTALWDEVARLANDEGVTVFLTTQYLEEADALADRVGIIDTGKIVAEGTPDALKAEIGRPTVEAAPLDGRRDRPRCARFLAGFGSPAARRARSRRRAARRGHGRARGRRPRARRGAGSRSSDLEIHTPTLDDVFLAKTGRRLEGAADGRRRGGERGDRGARGGPRERRTARFGPAAVRAPRGTLSQVGYLARRSITRTVRQPIADHPEPRLPAVPARRELERARGRDLAPGLPDRLVPDLRPRRSPSCRAALFATMGAGQSIAGDIQHGLLQPPAADPPARARRWSPASSPA